MQGLKNKAECEDAAESINLNRVYTTDDAMFPTGCYQLYGIVYWNNNKNGIRNPFAKAICKDMGESISLCRLFLFISG